MSSAPRAKTSPLKATVPLSCVTKQGSGLRSPGAPFRGSSSRIPDRGATIRRTASLDAIYLKGLFPKESVFWHRDRATQTDRSNSLDSLQTLAASETLEERVSKLTLNPRRRSCSREDKGDQAPLIRNPPSPIAKSSASVPPKSSRNSEEGLNQEVELYASAEPQCDRLTEPIPGGRKAPVAELISREGPYTRSHQSANQNSSEDSQGSSPDQDRMLSGSSPQINRFSSRAPPDGCERVLSKSVPILRPIPREVVSHPTTLYTLKPSSHSAFESLHRGMQVSQQDEEMDGDSPKVPEQEDP
ncbi:hypothetical protein MTP99_002343 [Tenebrio molitor]|jgi:hypothetical protein|nr:hypothetical protein MTP99_002343 [Tenebrio molitor]CAH1378513.1 unnamed protein product [Tenebrio molitor]